MGGGEGSGHWLRGHALTHGVSLRRWGSSFLSSAVRLETAGFPALPALLISTSIYAGRARKYGRAHEYDDLSVKWRLGQYPFTFTLWDHLEQCPAHGKGGSGRPVF